MRRATVPLLLLAACSGGGDDGGATYDETKVRAFAVSNHQRLDYASTYEDFKSEMRRVMEMVQPDFSDERPNLVVLGEDIGLAAAFIGTRGEFARAQTDSLTAFAGVAGSYINIVQHWQANYPEISLNRAVTLALTDTMARAFLGTYPELAAEYGVYLSACTLLPRLRTSDDPEDIAFFGDPDLADIPFVWLPADSNMYNVCYIWDPNGNEIGTSRKVNLVSLEGPDLLDLSHEALSNVTAFDLPFGRVAIAISLDAFIPAYLDHLDALGAQIVLQNDANPGPWAVFQSASDHLGQPVSGLVWQPEEWEDSTVRMVSHADYPNILFNICPMMVGNLFDVNFDGQSSITARYPPAGTPQRHYVGNPDQPNFVALGPWTFEDPGDSDSSLSIEERRERLRQQGLKLAAGSGDPQENGYIESHVWADLDVNAEAP